MAPRPSRMRIDHYRGLTVVVCGGLPPIGGDYNSADRRPQEKSGPSRQSVSPVPHIHKSARRTADGGHLPAPGMRFASLPEIVLDTGALLTVQKLAYPQ